MTGFLWAALGVISGFGLAAIGDMVSEEVRDRLDKLPRAILQLAARQLDEAERGVLYEEVWLPDLAYFLKGDEARPVTRLIKGTWFALGILRSARKSARYLRQANGATNRDVTTRSAEAVSDTVSHKVAAWLLGLIDDNVLGKLAAMGARNRWAVPLLRAALVIDPDAAARLLGVVDDNVLGDLARELTAVGEYGHARVAGTTMRLFHDTKADVLADLALAQAEAALQQRVAGRRDTAAGTSPGEPPGAADLRAAAETANLAADAARRALREGPDATMAPRVPRVAGRLAKAAAALTLAGEDAPAAHWWAEAMAAAEREPDPHRVLADFAQAQVRAGLLDEAAQVIAVLLGEPQPDAGDWQASAVLDRAWQAAAALVTALAERGDVDGATAVLRMIPDFAFSYPHAVRGLARVIAATDVAAAERLAGRLHDPDGRGRALAAVAAVALTAGHPGDAVRVAEGIEHPRWRAQALVDLAGAKGQAAGIPLDKIRGAIADVPDAGAGVVLLAEYAMTRDTGERRLLLAEAMRLVGEADPDDQWRVLADIGATLAEAGFAADAREAFTTAQRLLARNAREWDFELYQLYRVRLNTGDADGARETAAIALSTS